MSSLDNSLSHKGKKEGIRQWNSNAIDYAETNSNHKAGEFHVAIKGIREWRQNKLKIFEPTVKPQNKRFKGCRKKNQ